MSLPPASRQDGTYPRPLRVRASWTSLDGEWEFAFDDDDRGRGERWHEGAAADRFDRRIQVPFVPESDASGIGDCGFHPVVWYRRVFRTFSGHGERTLLHIGALDDTAEVWVDGTHVGSHVGGQTSFTLDLTDALEDSEDHLLVIRAADDPTQSEFPRGKQDWLHRPHEIWYERSTGIWRSVWLEVVPEVHITDTVWMYDPGRGCVDFAVELSSTPPAGWVLEVRLEFEGEPLGAVRVLATTDLVRGSVDLATLRNTQHREQYLWSPSNPRLVDIDVTLRDETDAVSDEIATYCGLRTVGVDRGRFLLNDRPFFVRSVLEQGYWPESQLTAPSPAHYRAEVELIRSLGFTAVRVHQKTEDPRFHFWADRLGLLVWGESAAPYGFSARGATRVVAEWAEIVKQYRGHPSIVTWVPVNESWGVQDLAHTAPQRALVSALTSLTHALDPSRPVVSNDGWEHVGGDLITIHDYTTEPAALAARYATWEALATSLEGMGPSGRRPLLTGSLAQDATVMVSEFGGISYADESTWGYATVSTSSAYEDILTQLFGALSSSPFLAGICYTQLTDTLQEANGLLLADRTPKLPIETLRRIVTG